MYKNVKNTLITDQGVRNSENPGFEKNPEIDQIQKSTLLLVHVYMGIPDAKHKVDNWRPKS